MFFLFHARHKMWGKSLSILLNSLFCVQCMLKPLIIFSLKFRLVTLEISRKSLSKQSIHITLTGFWHYSYLFPSNLDQLKLLCHRRCMYHDIPSFQIEGKYYVDDIHYNWSLFSRLHTISTVKVALLNWVSTWYVHCFP